MDQWVLNSQNWLNNTYSGVSGYNVIQADGVTGWNTMYAITRALQHELGITSLSDNFGSTTLSYLTSQFPTISASTQNSHPNVAAIIQCALWCKGYWGGTTFGTWDSGVIPSINLVNSDMGLGSLAYLIPKAAKSLLTMDAYIVVNGGSSDIREVQQWLNGTYKARQDYYLMPCDGHYSRGVQTGLMYAIQYELGMADGVANGNFGPGTQSGLQTYGSFGVGSIDGTRHLIKLFQGALRFNAYSVPFDGLFASSTSSVTSAFQQFAGLSNTGAANYQTWASLLVSTGDPTRSTTGFDTSTPLTSGTAASLYSAGYRTVGRYLNGSNKGIMAGELSAAFAAGLTVFPIYQEYNNASQYFSNSIGYTQGVAAARRARQLGIEAGAILYFPVDYDPTDDEISAIIIPYFQGVRDGVATSTSVSYQIGVYGTRNVCARISSQSLAVRSFTAGMSTGWSGNLGFSLPSNWAYDQIQTVTVSGVSIDKDVKSATATPVAAGGVVDTPVDLVGGVMHYDDLFWWLTEIDHIAETALSHYAAHVESKELVTEHLLAANSAYTTTKFQLYIPTAEAAGGSNGLAIASARAEFETSVTTRPSTASYGDLPHAAVTARGYLQHNAPTNDTVVEEGDLGGWALDLVTLWNSYASKRHDGTYVGTVYQWMYTHLGNSANMGINDLIADVDGYVIGYGGTTTPSRTFGDLMREILVETNLDVRWRYQRFYNLRFGGSQSTMVAAVKNIFTTLNPVVALPVDITTTYRAPGSIDSPSSTDPSTLELTTELDDLANGFVIRFLEFVNNVNPGNTGNPTSD